MSPPSGSGTSGRATFSSPRARRVSPDPGVAAASASNAPTVSRLERDEFETISRHPMRVTAHCENRTARFGSVALPIIENCLWCRFAHFKLCAHLLDLCGLLFELCRKRLYFFLL